MRGERIKQLRKAKKLTQEELGKIVNVTKVSISGYENGNRSPDTDTLQKLADILDTTTDYLLGRSDNPIIVKYKTNDDEQKPKLTEEQQTILEWALTKEDLSFSGKKEDIIEMLDRFVSFYKFEEEQKRKKEDKEK